MIDQDVFYVWCKRVDYKSFKKLIEKYKNIDDIIKTIMINLSRII